MNNEHTLGAKIREMRRELREAAEQAPYITPEYFRSTIDDLLKRANHIIQCAETLPSEPARRASEAVNGVYYDLIQIPGYTHPSRPEIDMDDYVQAVTDCKKARDLRLDDAALRCIAFVALPLTEDYGPIEGLSEIEKYILMAMIELDARDSDHRVSAEQIAHRATKGEPNNIKRSMSHLRKIKLVISKEGRGGGSWLTNDGIIRAQILTRNGAH